ncbi:MAG: flagellar basal-body MS-ring/collar protein FliF [Alphaproteobacteria bacterium]|nr:flagellar basal-body MS-ring/collar protein FliF [Alphaproteobacteria bacterium]
MNPLAQTLRNLGPFRIGVLAAVAVGLLAFFAVLGTRISAPGMSLLYANLDPAEANEIVTILEQSNVPFELSAGGTSVRVPRTKVDEMRIRLAGEGLPTGGSVGYELFDRADGLGGTTQEFRVRRSRALEGELARTISLLRPVRKARVHIVMPERQTFSRRQHQPTASVTLTVGGTLERGQVKAVQQLVAAAVPALQPANVTVVDQNGNLLARLDDASGSETVATAEEMRVAEQARLQSAIERMVASVVGYGKVQAEVTLDMNFDRMTETTENYDPDGQVVRSTNSVEESQQSQGGGDAPVTVDGNVPEPAGLPPPGGGETSQSQRLEETTNFEISTSVRNLVRDNPDIEKISVAVLVDGTYTGVGENRQYVPRGQEELDQINRLVRSAIGFDEQRGDAVEVINMPFAATDDGADQEQSLMDRLMAPDPSMVQLLETLAWAVATVLILLLFVRPLVNRILDAPPEPAPSADGQDAPLLADHSGGYVPAALPGPDGSVPTVSTMHGEDPDEEDSMINLDSVEGRVKASSVRRVGEIVDKHPDEAVAILRNWMYQES